MTAVIRASGIRGYVGLMRRLGVEPEGLLRRYRITAAMLQDEDTLLSLRTMIQLLEASAAATRCPDFGLRLSQDYDISVLGPVAIAMQNAPTVAEALDVASRYMFVHSPGLALAIHDESFVAPDSVELRAEIHLARQPPQRQMIDLCLCDLHQTLKVLAGSRYQLRAVALPHTPIAPLETYSRFFGAKVLTEQVHAGLHIARSTLEANLQTVNPTLRQIAVDYMSLQFGAPDEALSARVRQALRHTLGTGLGSKNEIAELLGMHPRTLQRRLVAERTSFEAVRDDLRKEIALRYLRETRIPLIQLAGILGLSEQSALARCCRRWFGAPPSRLRKQAGAGRIAAE